MHRRTGAAVAYDPEQPWRVVLPNDPPRPLLARAQLLDDEAAHGARRPAQGLPPGAHLLVTGAILAALLLVLVRLAG